MIEAEKQLILGIGNIYVETNYLGLETGEKDILEAGREYRARTYETRLGGSVVNFVLCAKTLGFEVGLIGKTGQDEAGEKLRKLLRDAEIADDLIIASSDVSTSVDTGVVLAHSGENIQFVSGDANQKLSLEDIDLNNPIFEKVSAVYLGGGLKQESLFPNYPELIRQLHSKNIKIFFDHGRFPVDTSKEKRDVLVEALSLVDGYFPNGQEIVDLTDIQDKDMALKRVLEMGPKIVVVKFGPEGCRVKTKDEDINFPGYKVNVVSTVGAGDAFNAGFIAQFLKGKSLRECGEFANATAALRISKNQIPLENEVLEFLATH